MSGHGNALGGAVVDIGSFDWMNGRHSSLLSDPNPSYHGIRFAETFGKLSYITFCHASVLRDLGPTMAPMNAFLTLTGLKLYRSVNIMKMPKGCAFLERS